MYSCIHTHSTFCDGSDTMERMAKAAFAAGIRVFGFSGHAYNPYEDYGIRPERMAEYLAEAARLKELYAGRMEILCGIESEECAERGIDFSRFDYIIGSCHDVLAENGVLYPVDDTPEQIAAAVRDGFSGDPMRLVRAYYEQLTAYLLRRRPTIIGHFDLICKTNLRAPFMDEDSAEYRKAACSALDAVLETGAVFEVNTGAVSRGWRTAPYPADFLLCRILERGGRVIITTDAHRADLLISGAPEAEKMLAQLGFHSVCELTAAGLIEREIVVS